MLASADFHGVIVMGLLCLAVACMVALYYAANYITRDWVDLKDDWFYQVDGPWVDEDGRIWMPTYNGYDSIVGSHVVDHLPKSQVKWIKTCAKFRTTQERISKMVENVFTKEEPF